jgi:hypothetical protein
VLHLDHLVVAARTLEEGTRWVRERVGVEMDPGGQHVGFGTHNALLRLGDDVYLEVLAPDQRQPSPPGGRLLGLDDDATRKLLEAGPRLLHWVVRTRGIEAAIRELAAAAGTDPTAIGVPTPMRRGSLEFTLAVPPDRGRPPAGLPYIIDWGDAPHPCTRLPEREVRLERLVIVAPAATVAALGDLRGDARIALAAGATVRLEASLVSSASKTTAAMSSA